MPLDIARRDRQTVWRRPEDDPRTAARAQRGNVPHKLREPQYMPTILLAHRGASWRMILEMVGLCRYDVKLTPSGVPVSVPHAKTLNHQEVCMGRTGRKRRVDLEDEYWQLILAGIGTVEACRRG